MAAWTLKIIDETATGKNLREVHVPMEKLRISIQDLIRARVEEEVRRYNNERPEYFQGLVQPTEAEESLNGYRTKERRAIDSEKQVYIALAAFQKNGFFILIDDAQAEDLDQEFEIKPDTKVSFVKLTPLVGG